MAASAGDLGPAVALAALRGGAEPMRLTGTGARVSDGRSGDSVEHAVTRWALDVSMHPISHAPHEPACRLPRRRRDMNPTIHLGRIAGIRIGVGLPPWSTRSASTGAAEGGRPAARQRVVSIVNSTEPESIGNQPSDLLTPCTGGARNANGRKHHDHQITDSGSRSRSGRGGSTHGRVRPTCARGRRLSLHRSLRQTDRRAGSRRSRIRLSASEQGAMSSRR